MRYLLNFLLAILPVSGFFGAKRFVARVAKISIGHAASLNGHSLFYGHGRIIIGTETWVGPRCRFYTGDNGDVLIGSNCDIAPEVVFVTGSHEIGSAKRRAGKGYCLPIVVEDGCWIGARVMILGGVTVGRGSIVAAGSVVTKSIPANSLVAGIPAKDKKCLD